MAWSRFEQLAKGAAPETGSTKPASARKCRLTPAFPPSADNITEDLFPMHSIARICSLLLGLALAQPLLAQTGPIKIAGLMELSGTGTTSGTNFNDGVKLAVKEINAAGGILGRKVEYSANDTQSQPQTAKALAVRAID